MWPKELKITMIVAIVVDTLVSISWVFALLTFIAFAEGYNPNVSGS